MSRGAGKRRKRVVRERCVIHYSQRDKCWVAHGLRTDQIGTGDCVVDALADYMRAIGQILAVAEADPTVAILRRAPLKVQRMAQNASPLPQEIYEIAHKVVHGDWPADVEPRFNIPPGKRLDTGIRQLELTGA